MCKLLDPLWLSISRNQLGNGLTGNCGLCITNRHPTQFTKNYHSRSKKNLDSIGRFRNRNWL